MKNRHLLKDYKYFNPNTQIYLETNSEKIIEETRKTLNNYLTNLLEHNASQSNLYNSNSIEEIYQSPKLKKTNNYRPVSLQKEKPSFTINNKNLNVNNKMLFTNQQPQQILNSSKSTTNRTQIRNYFSTPTITNNSKPTSQTKYRSIPNTENSMRKTQSYTLNLNYNNNFQNIQKINNDIKFIKNANIDNKKAIIMLNNFNKQCTKELLMNITKYISQYVQKEKELTNYIEKSKKNEKDTINEIQKYKRYVSSLSQTKNNLIRERSSLSQENREKFNEIQILKQELKSIRDEKTEKSNELKLLLSENEDFKIRNVKLIEENANLQIKMKEIEKNLKHSSQKLPLSFNNDLLMYETKISMNYLINPTDKQKNIFFIIKNQSFTYDSTNKKKNNFKITKPIQQTFHYDTTIINNNQRNISSNNNNNICNSTHPIKNNKVISPKERIKENNDLENQLQDVTQKYKSLLKNQKTLERENTELKQQLINKEKEISSQNVQISNTTNNYTQIYAELEEKINEIILKEQEIQSLKYNLENITNEFNVLKKEKDNEHLSKVLKELEESNKEKDLIKKENRQLQHKLKDKQTEIEKNREQIKSLSTDKIKHEITETTLHNQMDSLYDEIEYLKEQLYLKEKEEQQKKIKLQQLIDKTYNEGESIESLREKITMLRMELNTNNEYINKAKEGKEDLCSSNKNDTQKGSSALK